NEPIEDFLHARLDLFREQIAAGIVRCFTFLLAESGRRQCKRKPECRPHTPPISVETIFHYRRPKFLFLIILETVALASVVNALTALLPSESLIRNSPISTPRFFLSCWLAFSFNPSLH